MNFEPRIILPATAGSSVDARSASVRVMNEVPLLASRRVELANVFQLHLAKVGNSLAGFLTSDGTLSDGSTWRIVSNSGMHTIMVWPASPALAVPAQYADWFRAIPTSDSFISGSGTKPSWGWKLPHEREQLSAWPTTHKVISDRQHHPGHVVWSNPDLKFNGKPLVLSWRGPRDRYAATTGCATTTGSTIVAHEKDPSVPTLLLDLQLAEDVLKDSRYVWINGHKIDTGIPKVIAACLHQYDPSGHPGQFVLRVCADGAIASSNRQMVVYDLGPSSTEPGGSLKAIAEASTLEVKNTYLAADNTNDANYGGGSPGVGKWDYWQRPHFNKSGTRLATIITQVGANGTDREQRAVSFDPVTWVADNSVVAGIVGSYADSTTEQGTHVLNSTSTQELFVAADFEGDTFVYVKYAIERVYFRDAAPTSQINGSLYAGNTTIRDRVTFTITHSIMGEIRSWLTTTDYHIQYGYRRVDGVLHVFGDHTFTVVNGIHSNVTDVGYGLSMPKLAFLGDLSKRSFAVGYQEQDVGTYTADGHMDQVDVTGVFPKIPVSQESTLPRTVFDVYFDGQLVLEAGNGGFTLPALSTLASSYDGTPTLSSYADTNVRPTTTNDTDGGTARYGPAAAFASPPSFEGRLGNTGGGSPRAASYRYALAPMFQNCAIHPERAAGYYSAAYYDGDYGLSAITAGVDLMVVAPSSTPHTEIPAAYVTGNHPSLSAPVFMGLVDASGATT